VAVDIRGHLDGAVTDDLHDDARVNAERETGNQQCSNPPNAPRRIDGKSTRTASAATR
jgi:hypothetical protein